MYTTLAQCPLFRGLTAEQIQTMLDQHGDFTLNEFREGECIARQDTAYSGLMILLQGRVHGEMHSAKPFILIDPIEAPQLIAPAFLFGGYNRLPVDIVADSPVRILTLHRGYLFELMQENTIILSNFIDIISNRANIWSKKIFYCTFRSLQTKLADYLLKQTDAHNRVVDIPDLRELASYFDATRSALQTVIEEMQKRKLIIQKEPSILVTNREGLQLLLA
ncbi:MAG: helix-turn-helix domain-containing protein [Alistipes sp.]|nr:helix-turn-helix domain-containing protein [Alistipes sp.]